MSTKTKIIIGVVAVILLGGLTYKLVGDYAGAGYSIAALNAKYPEQKEKIEKVALWQKKVKEEPGNTGYYATLGLAWKSLADKVNDPKVYYEARKVYETAMQIVGPNNSLFITNAADMAFYEGEYEISEQYYRTAMVNTPGDEQIYLALARLLKFLKRSPEEILDVYNKGVAVLVPSTPLLLERADYYASIERYQEAIKDYEEVYRVTNRESIKQELEVLRERAGL